ncbi:4Fe-4S dicluster protein [Sulfuritortus calidifontis]|uniref:4Fe-4S dicluster protein n=1 Tax=Sulfuritortus calidifontis TaxID=1914471 RepID=A0A4R3JXL5_9PROT|nr:4Fe-4S binding protein [Sulfuritortus calidifontis]TCS71753.1 4Fe-4S dicluster protein [Sulfuritortus calidifontis]
MNTARSPAASVLHRVPGNCALIIGSADLLARRLDMVRAAGLKPALLDTDGGGSLPRGPRALPGRLHDLSGWAGAFTARLATARGPVDLAPLSYHADGHFDWVLDFSDQATCAAELPPPGYYRLAADDYPGLKRALIEIARSLREGFVKPEYLRFDAVRCLHARQGVAGCRRCLSTCPAGAIRAGSEAVHLESMLCQGCLACVPLCPTGALQSSQRQPADVMADLEARLAGGGRQAAAAPEGLWIGAPEALAEAPAGWLVWPAEAPAGLGPAIWLAALALGCRRVAIAPARPASVQRTLQDAIALAQGLLTGLGLPPAVASAADALTLPAIPALPPLPPAKLRAAGSERDLLLAALDHLAAARSAAGALPLVDAPFGEVVVEAERCTLCGACARLCPQAALSLAGVEGLTFTEARCVQCGLCANACPEQAIALRPRLLTDRSAREMPRRLVQATAPHCPGCGAPHAGPAPSTGSRVLAEQARLRPELARLLALCPECRQRAMAADLARAAPT